jgi:SLOG cluster2
MSVGRLNVSLEEYEIGLSGAVPEREHWSEPAMDRAILEFVALFSGLVFKYGGRIVHGSHPTFTPVILHQARLHAGGRARRPVTLVRSDLWPMSQDDQDSSTDIAELIITRKFGTKGADDAHTFESSLAAMRRVLIDAQNVMVTVGGKLHENDGKTPGVVVEMKMAADKGIPRFLVGGLGGASQDLASKLVPQSLGNFLSHEDNVTLFGTSDIGASVNVIFEHLSHSKELAGASRQPIRWNPGLKQIIDHRDGTVDTAATNYILDAHAT